MTESLLVAVVPGLLWLPDFHDVDRAWFVSGITTGFHCHQVAAVKSILCCEWHPNLRFSGYQLAMVNCIACL